MTATRPQAVLPLRRRADLEAAAASLRGQRCWTVKDPVSSRFFQLREEEQFILEQLDEPLSWQQLEQRVRERFAPRRVSRRQLESFVALLHREGLLVSRSSGQASRLIARRDEQAQRETWQRLLSPLAIRFRGVNPDALLNWLEPRTRWLTSRAAVGLSILLMLATLALLVGRLPQLAAELPALHQFFTASSFCYLAVALAVSKVLHELGHALACKRMGGRCRELGVMLLVFVPCLYCNVSDAWMLRLKWRRMAVSAAGVWVELMLACGGLWLWWLTEPGGLHSLGLSLAVVCSINSLLLNGNPLLRYDGYFVLADYWEIPNLFQQSRDRLRQLAVRWSTGLELPQRRSTPAPDRLLVPYGIASIAYRWFVVLAIWWVLWHGLRPWGLEALATVLLTLTVAAMLAPLIWSAAKFLHNPLRGRNVMSWTRLAATALLVTALLVGGMLAPLPADVSAPAVLQAQGLTPLRVVAPGQLEWAQQPGTDLLAGEPVARLSSLELQRELTAARSELRLQEQRVAGLSDRQLRDSQAESSLVVAEQSLTYYRRRVQQLEADAQRLEVRTPRAGRLYAPQPRDEGDGWRGTPLDPENLGARLEIDEVVGLVGAADKMEALALVPQADIAPLAVGQIVTIAADASPDRMLSGVVTEIAEVDAAHPSQELIETGLLAGAIDPQSRLPEAAQVVFEVRIEIQGNEPLPIGGLARVRIHTPRRTAWQRIRKGLAGLLQ